MVIWFEVLESDSATEMVTDRPGHFDSLAEVVLRECFFLIDCVCISRVQLPHLVLPKECGKKRHLTTILPGIVPH